MASGVAISSLIVLVISHSSTVRPNLLAVRPSILSYLLNRAFHIEVAFRHVVMLAFQDLLKTTNGLRHGNLFPFAAGKHLRHTERLAQKALNLTCTKYG